MMLSGNSLLKRPIIAFNSANIVGYNEDILIDPFSKRLAAFITNRSNLNEMMVVPWTGIKAIRPDQIVVWASSMLVRAKDIFELRHLLQRDIIKRGTQIKSVNGDFLGEMTDAYIDERTGELTGYEVFGGVLAPGTREWGFLPVPEVITVNRNEAIAHVDHDAIFPSVSTEACVERLNETIQQLGKDVCEQMDTESKLAPHLLTHLVGCAAQHTITTYDNYIVAVKGQVITNKTLDYAQRTRSESRLLMAVDFDLNKHLATL